MATKNELAPKKGWYTSEFWVALGPTALLILSAVGVDVTATDVNDVLLAIGGAVSGVYVFARTLLKVFRIKNADKLLAAETVENPQRPDVTKP